MGKLFILIGLCLCLSSCKGLLPFLASAAQGAQWIGSLIDVADAGQKVYFAKHPAQAHQDDVSTTLQAARQAIAAFDAAVVAARAGDAGQVDKAKAEALIAYGALRDLLYSIGVLSGRPPDGGAETDAPTPQPFELPTSSQVASLLASP